MARSRVVASAKLILYVNGSRFTPVTSFDWRSDTPRRAIYGLDSASPYEVIPTQTRVTGTVGLVKILSDGGLEGAGIAARLEDISREKYFTMSLVDISTDTTVFSASQCSVTSQSWSAPAKGFVTGRFDFEGILWNNEFKV